MKKEINFGYLLFLSVIAAIGGFLFGYDAAVISGTIVQVGKQFDLNAMQQGWYVGCALVGSIIGVMCAGVLSDRFGRKKVLLIAAVCFFLSGIWCALCSGFEELVIARMLGGMGIGVVSIVSPLYISEMAVARYRGRLVSLYQLAVTVGFLGAYLVNYQLLRVSEGGFESGIGIFNKIFVTEVWRGMLGMESLPAIVFFAVIFFIPESPRWLISKKKEVSARSVLERIYLSSAEINRQIQDTRTAVGEDSGKSEWKTLFRPGIMKAVLIGVGIAMLGQFMGVNAVLYYGPAIFEQAGLSGGDSLFYQTLIGLVNVVTTIFATLVIDKVGRKTLVYYGVSGMILSLLLISFYFSFGKIFGLTSIFLLCFFLFYIFCCAASISAVIWVLLSEMYPTKIRGLAMSIAGLSLWVGTYLIGQLTPWMLNSLMPSGTFLLFALMCIPYLLIVWKLVPETTGKTLEEIENYWESKAKNKKRN